MGTHVNNQYFNENDLFFIERMALEKIRGTSLFYPCSGADILTPIHFFSPYVQEFLFVDRGYFRSGHPDTFHHGLDLPADQHTPVLARDHKYQLLYVDIKGSTDQSYSDFEIEPCLRSEVYKHLPSGKLITIKKRRGYGYSAFRKDVPSLGVFFYRGDSQGEGGSGNHWLKREHIQEVLSKISENGLFVLDGSSGLPRQSRFGEYSSFWKYDLNFKSQQDVKNLCKPFKDMSDNYFSCVGYIGKRYGNTLVWRVEVNRKRV